MWVGILSKNDMEGWGSHGSHIPIKGGLYKTGAARGEGAPFPFGMTLLRYSKPYGCTLLVYQLLTTTLTMPASILTLRPPTADHYPNHP